MKDSVVSAQPHAWVPDLGFHPPAFLPALSSASNEQAAVAPIAEKSVRIEDEAPVPEAFPARDGMWDTFL